MVHLYDEVRGTLHFENPIIPYLRTEKWKTRKKNVEGMPGRGHIPQHGSFL